MHQHSRLRRLLWVLAALLLWPASTLADPDGQDSDGQDSDGQDSDALFDALMSPAQNQPTAAQGEAAKETAESDEAAVPESAGRADQGMVQVPLALFDDVSRRAIAPSATRSAGPPVELGTAAYEVRALDDALALTCRLPLTLRGPGLKTVPLIGDDTVLVAATVDGEAVATTRRSGYHVWLTERTGLVAVELSVLVAAGGPRGSLEYSFRVARTPAAELQLDLGRGGLVPQLDGVVQSEIRRPGDRTEVTATLGPTTHLRLIGLRDVSSDRQQPARVYAEIESLLSIDERGFELFSVIRYAILHGGTKSFEIAIPKGLDIVSVEGEGALRHTVEPQGAGLLIRAETAFPIRHHYELSLRLRRKTPGLKALEVPLLKSRGVERQHGWLAVEVPGKLRVAEAERRELVAVDARQLPAEIVDSAVSPILYAYRHHRQAPRLQLEITQLPEQELASATIDAVDATSVLSPEGTVLTRVDITLRNRLRHSLALTLPEGSRLRTALLGSEPVKPSRGADGRLLLPLKRSRGRERLEPFTLQVVLEADLGALGWWGRRQLALPRLELPVSSLRWQLSLPGSHRYGELRTALEPQHLTSTASWHKPPHLRQAVRWDDDLAPEGAAPTATAVSGALPVPIALPSSGVQQEIVRYWVEADEQVTVQVRHLRRWLVLPCALLLALLAALGVIQLAPLWLRRAGRLPARRRWAARLSGLCLGGCWLAALALLWELSGPWWVAAAVSGGSSWVLYRRLARRRGRLVRLCRVGLRRMPRRLRAWRQQQCWSVGRILKLGVLTAAALVLAWELGTRLLALGTVLAKPLLATLPG